MPLGSGRWNAPSSADVLSLPIGPEPVATFAAAPGHGQSTASSLGDGAQPRAANDTPALLPRLRDALLMEIGPWNRPGR